MLVVLFQQMYVEGLHSSEDLLPWGNSGEALMTRTAIDEAKEELMTGHIMTWRKLGGGAMDSMG